MGSRNGTKRAVRASERGHAKEAWLGDADRVGQKMTHPLWWPGYGPAVEANYTSVREKGSRLLVTAYARKYAHGQLLRKRKRTAYTEYFVAPVLEF